MRCNMQQARSFTASLDQVPNDVLRNALAPKLPSARDSTKDSAFSNLGCYDPPIEGGFGPLRNGHGADVTTLAAGRAQAQTDDAIVAAVEKKELPAMEAGAMCHMMSKQGYGGDSVEHWHPHLMFYFSWIDLASWGENLPGSPVVGVSDDHEHLTEFVVAVKRWSDGTEAH